MRRQVYVTPKSYLSFLKLFQKLYKDKFEQLDIDEKNFKIGIQKIKEAKEDIEKLEKQLKIEEEKIWVKKDQVEEIIVELNKERTKSNIKQEEVTKEKDKIELEWQAIEKDKNVCEYELSLSMPALLKAQQAANQISAKEISDLKPVLLQNTHIVMKYIVDAINIVLY